jgi:hypothetical protein
MLQLWRGEPDCTHDDVGGPRRGEPLARTRFVRSSSAGSVDPTATDQQRRDLTGATDVQPGRIIRTPYIAHVTAGS